MAVEFRYWVRKTLVRLGIIKIGPRVASEQDGDIRIRMKSKHSKVFRKIPGKLNTRQHKLYIDDNVPGVIQKQYRIPLNRREKVKQKLDELLAWDFIEKVDEPSKWVSRKSSWKTKWGHTFVCWYEKDKRCS